MNKEHKYIFKFFIMFEHFLYEIQTTPPRTSAALKSIKKNKKTRNRKLHKMLKFYYGNFMVELPEK